MKLSQMFSNFNLMSDNQQEQFVREYRTKREKELNTIALVSKVSSSSTFTKEEKELIKKLGISMKDLISMRADEQDDDDEECEVT